MLLQYHNSLSVSLTHCVLSSFKIWKMCTIFLVGYFLTWKWWHLPKFYWFMCQVNRKHIWRTNTQSDTICVLSLLFSRWVFRLRFRLRRKPLKRNGHCWTSICFIMPQDYKNTVHSWNHIKVRLIVTYIYLGAGRFLN